MSQSLTESEILNLAAKIAVQAKIDRVERSQIENLLAVAETALDPKNSPWIVTLYAYRQVERRRIGKKTADLIYEAMSKLGGREDVRRLLGLVKWMYESLEAVSRPLPRDVENLTFQGFLEILKGG